MQVMQVMRYIVRIFSLLAVLYSAMPWAWADAPVVDMSEGTENTEAVPQGVPPDETVMNSESDQSISNSPSNSPLAENQATPPPPVPEDEDAIPEQTANLTVEQRLIRLEQQVIHINEFQRQIAQMQQAIQQLQGRVDEQEHTLQTINTQQRNFYQDINQRLEQLKALIKPGNNSPTPTPNLTVTQSRNESGKVIQKTSVKKNNADEDSVNNKLTDTLEKSQSDTLANTVKPKNGEANDTTALADQKNYELGLTSLKNKQYDRAVNYFRAYLKASPDGKYAVNAHYWLGEIYFLLKRPDNALDELNTVLQNYPNNEKVPDAMLKVAIIHDSRGKHQQSISMLKQIRHRYPNTTASRLAALRLQLVEVNKG